MTLIVDVFRTLVSVIDKMVYSFIEFLVSAFDELASFQLFKTELIETMGERFFFLLSIIMVFKVSFSIIQYIINPDSVSDKQNGMGKMIQSILLALVGLVVVNSAFKLAYNVQRKVLDNNIVPSLILGVNPNFATSDNTKGDSDSVTRQQETKSRIPFNIIKSFVTPNYQQMDNIAYNAGVYSCGGTAMYNSEGKYDSGFGTCFGGKTEKSSEFSAKYNAAHNDYNFIYLLDIINFKRDDDADVYALDYKMLISTTVGVFVIIMYINFCLDLAIRCVKLGFLQLIAPIPIISMVDPKSSKSGMMSKWLKTTLQVYAGLFIRLAAVNFVVLIVDIVFSGDTLSKSNNVLINVILLIGALMFAKDLPKLISDITGVDMKGDFKMNPLKRLPAEVTKPLGAAGAVALGAAGGVTANAINSVRGLRNNWGTLNNGERARAIGRSLLSVGAGGISAAVRGGYGSATGKQKNPFSAARAGVKGSTDARNLREQREATNAGGPRGFVNRRISDIRNFAGVTDGLTRFDNELKALSEVENDAKAILTRANEEMIKHDDLQAQYKELDLDVNGNVQFEPNGEVKYKNKATTMTMFNFKVKKESLKALRAQDTSGMNAADFDNHMKLVSALESEISQGEKVFEQAYVDEAMKVATDPTKKIADASIESKVNGLRLKVEHSPYDSIKGNAATTGLDIKNLKTAMHDAQDYIKGTSAYEQAVVNKKTESK